MLSFFPLDVLDGIWDLIESVSEEFLTYSSILKNVNRQNSVNNVGGVKVLCIIFANALYSHKVSCKTFSQFYSYTVGMIKIYEVK